MREVEVEELRKIQVEILDQVAAFCEENEIPYWLSYGTLLGAVRHKGFIPWDDDIDISMLRPDYERFVQSFNSAFAGTKYVFRSVEIDKDWHLPFGKVMDTSTLFVQDGHDLGINIDVFPHDDVPDRQTAEKMYTLRDRLKVLNAAQRNSNPPSGNLLRKAVVYCIRLVLHLLPEYFFIRKLSQMAQKHNGKGLTYVGDFTGESRMKPCGKDLVTTRIDGVFEGKTYKIPQGYDEWLVSLYGSDYMQPPPEEKRKRHTFRAYVNEAAEVN